jgi:hypothetical protein
MEFYLKTIPNPSSSAVALPVLIKHPNLRTLTVQNDNPGDHDISILLGSIECLVLTHLTPAPTQDDGDVSTLQYAQPLLRSASTLINHTLLECDILDSDDSSLLLSLNGAIQHLSVPRIGRDPSPTWIPDLLTSFMNP